MAKQEGIQIDNCIVDSELGYGKFKVKLPNDKYATCHLSGKMKLHKIRVVAFDRVVIELPPYDLTQGIITYRYK